jgi:hypothetical protein
MSNNTERVCFVIMPFSAELHYFYLFLKRHIEEKHGVKCIRGDADILTVPLLDKIRTYIDMAEVLIADCSGRNPNVFYELGIAHALGKKVILITKDSIVEAPADIRHYEFIHYEFGKDKEFLDSVDKALRSIFVGRYNDLYKIAAAVFEEFRQLTTSKARIATKEIFVEQVVVAERLGAVPAIEDRSRLREFLLLRIIADKNDRDVITDMNKWFEHELELTIPDPGK